MVSKLLANKYKIGFANGKDIKSVGRPQKQVNNNVWPTEYVLYILSQWNKPGAASKFCHWQPNSDFHDEGT